MSSSVALHLVSCFGICFIASGSRNHFGTIDVSDFETNALSVELLQTSIAFQQKRGRSGNVPAEGLERSGTVPEEVSASGWTPISPTATAGACGHNFNFSNLDPQDTSWTAEEFIAAWEAERSKLSVPFYMYDGIVGTVNFSAAQAALQDCTHNFSQGGHAAGEQFIYQQLQHHPWRVASSKDAKIIVVPIALTATGRYFMKHNYAVLRTGRPGVCEGYDAAAMFAAVVEGSLYHQRPKDHLFLDLDDAAIPNNFQNGALGFNPRNSLFAKQCTGGPWMKTTYTLPELRDYEYCRPPGTLVAPYCPQEEGTADNEERNVSMYFVGQVYRPSKKNEYVARLAMFNKSETMPNRAVLISTDPPRNGSANNAPPTDDLPQCPSNITSANWTNFPCIGVCEGDCSKHMLQHSQFALCPRGDNPTSQRLYDAMNFGAIPIFISDDSFSTSNPFQCFVPYNHISVKVAEAECIEDCGNALKRATSRFDTAALHRTRQLIRHFRKDLLWKAEGSRVMENLLLTSLQMRNPEGVDLAGCCEKPCNPI